MGRKRVESWLVPAVLGVGIALFCLWLTGPWVTPLLTGQLPRLQVGLTVEEGGVAFTVRLVKPDRAVEGS